MFSITMEFLSHGNSSVLIFHWPSSFSLESISLKFQCATDLKAHCLSKPTHIYPQHAHAQENAIKRKEREREKFSSIHWAHSRKLNNTALTGEGGGKVAQWCHDSHCQTTETDTNPAYVWEILCEFACECICFWVCLHIPQRVLKCVWAVERFAQRGRTLVCWTSPPPLCGLEVPVSILSNDLVSWMGNRPFVGNSLKKRGAVSMHTSFRFAQHTALELSPLSPRPLRIKNVPLASWKAAQFACVLCLCLLWETEWKRNSKNAGFQRHCLILGTQNS